MTDATRGAGEQAAGQAALRETAAGDGPADDLPEPPETVPDSSGGPDRVEPPPTGRSKGFGCAVEAIETLVLTLVIFLVVHAFIAQPFQVKGDSMQRTFETGEFVLVDKLSPRWDAYRRGDVVVLEPPTEFQLRDHEPFIKRVIGLPGETVEVRDGRVWIDGRALDETYTYDGDSTDPITDQARWVVGADQVFVMGDHREASEDSRAFGPINRGRIIGRAFLRYWPIATIGFVGHPTYAGPTAGAAAP